MQTDGYILLTRRNLGERIRLLRNRLHLTQVDFAKMIGMNRSYLVGIENGHRNVSVDNLVKIAGGLNVSLSTLVEGIDVEYLSNSRRDSQTVPSTSSPVIPSTALSATTPAELPPASSAELPVAPPDSPGPEDETEAELEAETEPGSETDADPEPESDQK